MRVAAIENAIRDCSEDKMVSLNIGGKVFLTLRAPIKPVSAGSLYRLVSTRIEKLGIHTLHCGPHALRHACATHLVSEGFSLKEIGDHLGHRSTDATRIYAKVDLPHLREVAAFNFGGVL